MPKITVMSAEKAFLSAHYGGPFNKEDFNPNDGDAYHNLEIGPINVDNYYEIAKLEPINRYLIKNRLNNITNQPLVSSNNVATIADIKTTLQYSRKD